MNLTAIVLLSYFDLALAKSSARIGVLNFPSTQVLNRSTFFVSALWWALWECFRARRFSEYGNANPATSATQLIGVNRGSSQKFSEDYTMSNLTAFDFKNHTVRVVSNDPLNPLFVAKDVALALGYKVPEQAINDRCKGSVKRLPLSTKGGTQQVRVIGEADLYRLIFGSKLKSAVAFQNWVFEEVLPAIRKTGQYKPAQTPQALTPAQQRHVQERVSELVYSAPPQNGVTYQSLYSKIKKHFQVGSYKDIPQDQYPELCRYLRCEPRGDAPRTSQLMPDLPSGRYLVIKRGFEVRIINADAHNLISSKHVFTLRKNFKLLAEQMRILLGEQSQEVMDLPLESLR